ncbi:MAG TPA: hypothetical protein VEL76_33835 [Gemmataceae bacterium]|nr:hypothetical protein [Gemmataceae bacterium]
MSSRRAALTALLLVCGLGGCGTARQITVTSDGGCIAIPENSDVWPTNYRTKAIELMKKQCPQGYVIVREEEVVTGKVRTDSEATDTQTQDVSSRRRPNATLTTTSTSHTSAVRDQTEYRIYYQKTGASTGVQGRAPAMVMTPPPAQPPVTRVVPASSTLPPEPRPVALP